MYRAHAAGLRKQRKRLIVHTRTRHDREARAGARGVRAKLRASFHRGSFATAREDAIYLRDPGKGVDRGERIRERIERTMERQGNARRCVEHDRQIGERQLPRLREPRDEAVDANAGEAGSRTLQRTHFVRSRFEPGILADHDTQRKRDLRGDSCDKGKRRRQSAVTNRTDDFEAVSTALRRRARVGNGLNDDFDEEAAHP